MTNDEFWQDFARSGRVNDYLRYAFGSAKDAPQDTGGGNLSKEQES